MHGGVASRGYYNLQGYLKQLFFMSSEDISEHFGQSLHGKNLIFENFGESYLKMENQSRKK